MDPNPEVVDFADNELFAVTAFSLAYAHGISWYETYADAQS